MRVRRAVRGLFAVAGIVLTTTWAIMAVQVILAERFYRQTSEEMSTVEDAESGWNRLQKTNDETVGWLTVDGTPINYPIVQPKGSTPEDFYLSHDFWKHADGGGCPYLDTRAQAGGRHLLVFGHRFAGTERMFSSLSYAWDERVFFSIGPASLSAPNRAAESFAPLCALRVDQDFPNIQRFDFEHGAALRSWLTDIVKQADVRCENSEVSIGRAERVLTLVTCAGNRGGGRERALVIFSSDTQTDLARTG